MAGRLAVWFPFDVTQPVPKGFTDDVADQLLSLWTVAWHPALIHRCQSVPEPISDPHGLGTGAPLLVLTLESDLASTVGATVWPKDASIIQLRFPRTQMLAELQSSGWIPRADIVSGQLIESFFSLGYVALQIRWLARYLHFSDAFDSTLLTERCLKAADLIWNSSPDAEAALSSCFDALLDMRHRFYPVDIHLLDWSLMSPRTDASSVTAAFSVGGQRNVWLTGEILERAEPSVQKALRDAMDGKRWKLIGGELAELALPLWPGDVAVDQVMRGLSRMESILHVRPRVFARRRDGLTSRLPSLLNALGYVGAIHSTLDECGSPKPAQARTQWMGPGTDHVDALGSTPLDARRATTFLRLHEALGHSIQKDYVATLCLANWLNLCHPAYADLQRSCGHSPVLGRFESIDSYLQDTSPMGQNADFQAGDYQYPYLRTQVRRGLENPISRWSDAWHVLKELDVAATITVWANMIVGRVHSSAKELQREVQTHGGNCICHCDPSPWMEMPAPSNVAFDRSSSNIFCARAAAYLAEQITTPLPNPDNAPWGTLIVNPTDRNQRLNVTGTPATNVAEPTAALNIYAQRALATGQSAIVVDVPAHGYQWLPFLACHAGEYNDSMGKVWDASEPARAGHSFHLQNDFIRARIDRESGGLASLSAIHERENRLSQRLVYVNEFAGRGDDLQAIHARMVADEIQVVHHSVIRQTILSRGRLLDEQQGQCCWYEQYFEIWHGARHLDLRITLQPTVELSRDPWRHYVASRFRWRSDDASICTLAHDMVQRTTAPHWESPLGFGMEDGKRSTWVFTGGQPFHRRVTNRQCDTLLVVSGESRRTFHLRICIDPPQPLHAAHAPLIPLVAAECRRPRHVSGWFFHINMASVRVTRWRAIESEDRVVGGRIRLWESSGKPVRGILRCFRPIRAAEKVDFLGRSMGDCDCRDGAVSINLAPFEWTDLEFRW